MQYVSVLHRSAVCIFLLTGGSETHITCVCSSVNCSEQETEQPISTPQQTDKTASNEARV